MNLREVEKLPALELRAVGEIRVLSKGVVLPAARVVNGFAPPDTRGAVEIEESAAPGTRAVLDHEGAVTKNRFHVGEQGIVAVEIGTAPLHHSDFAAAVGIHG